MTFFDWLSSPIGIQLEHAVIALVLAIAGYLTYLTHGRLEAANSKLDKHMADHVDSQEPPEVVS